MSLMKRMSLIFKAKANKALDKAEDPREVLDYSYQKQQELLEAPVDPAKLVGGGLLVRLVRIERIGHRSRCRRARRSAVLGDRSRPPFDALDEAAGGIEREGATVVGTNLEEEPVRAARARGPDDLREQLRGEPGATVRPIDRDPLQLGDVAGDRDHGVADHRVVGVGRDQIRHRGQRP